MRRPPLFAVYSSSLGNYFFDEIRDLLACGLRDLGFQAVTADETRGLLDNASWHLVVAPHEFFAIGLGMKLRRSKLPRNLILFNTEQPGSPWFPLALDLFPRAWAVWDMDRDTCWLIQAKGFPGRHVPLGYSARFPLFSPVRSLPPDGRAAYLEPAARRWPGWRLSGRPLDILFAGQMTERRNLFFTRNAEALSVLRSCFLFADARNPLRPKAAGGTQSRAMIGLAQRSKIVLNLHRKQARYFEWHRMALHGIGQRALVLTEPTAPAPPLRPGHDFIEAPMEEMPDRIKRLLLCAEGLREAQAVAEQGFETFSRRCRMADFLKPPLEELLASRRASKPPALNDKAQELPPLRASRAPAAQRLAGGGRSGPIPKATVAVSLYNYRRHIIPCLESVRAQTLGGVDLIVVDDASTDGSAEAARSWLESRGGRFSRWLLLGHRPNAGLALSRNAAFERARTPFVFVLDADNLLLPPCLERLAAALESSRAQAAFSYLHAFGEEEYLMNIKPWDPALLRARPCLDAMALVRRSAWRGLGGYRRQVVQGWEDYDFWLRLARAGGRAVQVPEVLARYRVHLSSMLCTETAPDEHRLRRYFQLEHQVSLDADNLSQPGLAEGVFGGGALPVRVESPSKNGAQPRRGEYLVAALAILRDLNRDLLERSR